MASSLVSSRAKQRVDSEQALIAGKRRRKMREALIGYLFVFPATAATLIFGLWPVIAGFYESIKSGSPITNKYVGLNNYIRALGSLTYVLLFALCVILIYAGYQSWRGAYRYQREHGGNFWYYVLPGLLAGSALVVLGFLLVTGTDGYFWFAVLLLLLTILIFYLVEYGQESPLNRERRSLQYVLASLAVFTAAWFGGPEIIHRLGLGTVGWIFLFALVGGTIYLALPAFSQIKNWQYINAATTMGTMIILAVVLGRYTVGQLDASTNEARHISQLLFNQRVLDGVVKITDENALVGGLKFENGEVIVKVNVDGQTIEAPLAPQVYSELPVDKIARIETAFANNQKVQVVLPDGSSAEGQITGIAQGEQLVVGLTADQPQGVREIDIYSALDVGEAVVRNNGHTEPLMKQIYAVLGILVGMAAVYMMTLERRKLDDDLFPQLYRWLYRGRLMIAVAVLIMFLYLVGAAQLNQQAAAGMGALTEDQFKMAYEFATGVKPPAIMRAEVLKAELLYWPQVFSVMVGAVLIGAAYLVWQSAQKRETPAGFGLTILLAVLMMVGGWLTLGELPRTLSLGGRETEEAIDSLNRTAMYSVGTVPIQLMLGLFLAYLLFSEISWG
ncbi:MAG: sugar ABC transporter permease, partial [Chloroflexi bacterium]|nr:sugar ABC transporter permease [Chloroflexota bacterium]